MSAVWPAGSRPLSSVMIAGFSAANSICATASMSSSVAVRTGGGGGVRGLSGGDQGCIIVSIGTDR